MPQQELSDRLFVHLNTHVLTNHQENMFLKEKLALFNEEASLVESEQRREGVEEKVVRSETLRRKHTATTNVPNDMKV